MLKGRLIAYCNSMVTEDDVKLLCEPDSIQRLKDYLNRYVDGLTHRWIRKVA